MTIFAIISKLIDIDRPTNMAHKMERWIPRMIKAPSSLIQIIISFVVSIPLVRVHRCSLLTDTKYTILLEKYDATHALSSDFPELGAKVFQGS